MGKKSSYFVLSFGFFLGWLLSFLYNGPALEIIFAGRSINLKYLSVSYILTSSIFSFYYGFFKIKENHKAVFMKYAIYVNLTGTLLAILASRFSFAAASYVIAGIMGVFSVLFIAGWGCYFVRFLSIKVMYKYMAFAICLGNIIFHVNEILAAQGFNNIVILLLYVSLIGSCFASHKLIKANNSINPTLNLQLPVDLLVMMCFLMFFLNVGGGVVQTLINPLAENSFKMIHIIDIITYAVFGITIYKTKKNYSIDILLILSIVIIASGYLTLIVFPNNLIPAYTLIVIGYAALDIIIWTLVAQLGHIYGSPIRIFLFIMASNLLAVFIGNILGSLLAPTTQSLYVSIALSALSTILAFAFVPFIIKFLNNGIIELQDLIDREAELQGVVTVAKAINQLTPKESEIYKLMLLKLKNKEIAARANISENTLKGHARSIYKKFQVGNKKELLSRVEKGVY